MLNIELISMDHTCPTQSWADVHTVKPQFMIAAVLMQIKHTKKPLNCSNRSKLTKYHSPNKNTQKMMLLNAA